jgi:hypothetical protein
MTGELACSQESRNRHSLRFPEVTPTLNFYTNRTESSQYFTSPITAVHSIGRCNTCGPQKLHLAVFNVP